MSLRCVLFEPKATLTATQTLQTLLPHAREMAALRMAGAAYGSWLRTYGRLGRIGLSLEE